MRVATALLLTAAAPAALALPAAGRRDSTLQPPEGTAPAQLAAGSNASATGVTASDTQHPQPRQPAAPAPHTVMTGTSDPAQTLVVLLGNARGGPTTWSTLFQHMLEPFRADLALAFGMPAAACSDPTCKQGYFESVAPDLAKRAKYIWTFEDKVSDQEWMDTFDAIKPPSLANVPRDQFGDSLQSVSSSIVMYMRWWLVKEHIHDMQRYQNIVLTRADQFYLCPPSFIAPNTAEILVVEGEEYGGVTDRFMVFPSKNIADVVDIVSNATPDDMKLENVESLQKRRWEESGLTISSFPRSMITVATEEDQSHQKKATKEDGTVPGHPELLKKYPEEYAPAVKTCGLEEHEQHEQQARQKQAAQQQSQQQQAASPPDCPTAAEVQATAEGERWAVWDVADDPESSACRLDQLAGECGDNAPCQVRPKDSAAQRAEAG